MARALLAPSAALLLAMTAAPSAQTPEPATVGRDRPLTSSWLCENERSVLLNVHPRRPAEEAWLTYAGTRVAVKRVRPAPELTYQTADGGVKWAERGHEAVLVFDGLLSRPLLCRRQEPLPR